MREFWTEINFADQGKGDLAVGRVSRPIRVEIQEEDGGDRFCNFAQPSQIAIQESSGEGRFPG